MNDQVIERAKNHFAAIVEEQMARVEKMKKAEDWIDYGKIDPVKIGFCWGDGIGPIIGKSVAQWFKNTNNRALLARLQKHLKIQKVTAPSKGQLTDKTVVITGTLPTLSREEAEALVRRAGGKPASAVSAKTSFVVAGESAGSKLAKAEQLGVPVISEAELLDKLKG